MDKATKIFGGILCAAALIITSLYGVSLCQSHRFDESSRAYVLTNVRPILASWSMTALKKRASPRLLDVLNKQGAQADCLMKSFSQLGALTAEGDPQGRSDTAYFSGKGTPTAIYEENDQFARGNATITIGLIFLKGQWWIRSFHVASPNLDAWSLNRVADVICAN